MMSAVDLAWYEAMIWSTRLRHRGVLAHQETPPLLGNAGPAHAVDVLVGRREEARRALLVDPAGEDHAAAGRVRARRARLVAGAAAVALGDVHEARLAAHRDLEVPDEPLDLVHLGVGEQADVGVLARPRPSSGSGCRPRSRASGRSCRSWPCGRRSRARARPGRLRTPRPPSAAPPRCRRSRRRRPASRRLICTLRISSGCCRATRRTAAFDQRPRLARGGDRVDRDPRHLLADVRHVEQVAVQTRALAPPSGTSARASAGCTPRPRREFSPSSRMSFWISVLAGVGAHEPVVAGDDDARAAWRPRPRPRRRPRSWRCWCRSGRRRRRCGCRCRRGLAVAHACTSIRRASSARQRHDHLVELQLLRRQPEGEPDELREVDDRHAEVRCRNVWLIRS